MLRQGSKAPPIHVSEQGGPDSPYRYRIEDGRHRVAAAKFAGHTKIKAIIVEPGYLYVV